jgi:phosphohistidine phosphatase
MRKQSMNLYLIRHAEAAELNAGDERDDSERPLTDAGRAQCAALASALQARGVTLNQVVTSPLLRARQTVEALLEHWPTPHPEQLTCNALAPGGRAKKITRFLLGLNGENVGLVGHMPDLAEYAGWLIGTKKTRLEMAKAGAAFIRFDGSPDKGEGALVWLATPEWFEAGSAGK